MSAKYNFFQTIFFYIRFKMIYSIANKFTIDIIHILQARQQKMLR